MAIMAMGRLYEHMAERLTKWGKSTKYETMTMKSVRKLRTLSEHILFHSFNLKHTACVFRDASHAVWLWRQPDVQSVHLPVHQLLLLHHLHRLLQGQVRRLPWPLSQHLRQSQKWRRKKSFLQKMRNMRYFYFQCGNGGCLIELAQQLAVIMIGRSTRKLVGWLAAGGGGGVNLVAW